VSFDRKPVAPNDFFNSCPSFYNERLNKIVLSIKGSISYSRFSLTPVPVVNPLATATFYLKSS